MKSRFSPFKMNLLGFLGAMLLRMLLPTVRVRFFYPNGTTGKAIPNQKSVIYAFWHGRMLIPAWLGRGRRIHILISQHRDGEYINQVVKRFGYAPIRGSSSRNGAKALRQMAELAERDREIAITPDGPLGPKYVVQPGVILLAQKTGREIIPAGVAVDRYWQMPSWDEFRVPKPFSRAMIILGKPMKIPDKISKKEMENYRRQLEEEMRRLTAEAERRAREPGKQE